jgi:dihydroxyacetone kinase-like protein
MGQRVGTAFVIRWMREVAAGVHEQRDHLTQLDAAIGDADHGINMDRGFGVAMDRVDDLEEGRPGLVLETVGTSLVLSVGGAAGPLYGSAIRAMGRSLPETEDVDAEDLLVALRSALDEIQRLGTAEPGDKTMVDAFVPAIDGFERGLRAGEGLPSAAARAHAAAEEGSRATIPMKARKGRASYLGARSVGHQDPGAVSTAIFFQALEAAAAGVAP